MRGELMAFQVNRIQESKLIATLLAIVSLAILAAPCSRAQGAIRVESNEVLVPVVVWDKDKVKDSSKYGERIIRALLAGDTATADAVAEQLIIAKLEAVDFQVFEDGKVQTIRNVRYEQSLYWDLRDNTGRHTEFIGPGGGKWSTGEWPSGTVGDLRAPHYLISYEPPPSPNGSCHQVKLKVMRKNAGVAARDEYCNTKHTAQDPLSGTKLAEQLERVMATSRSSDFGLSPYTVTRYASDGSLNQFISVDWPGELLRGNIREKGILGLVLAQDGTVVTRFSDLAEQEGVPNREFPLYQSDRPGGPVPENHYENVLGLAPGEYELRLTLGDGTRFGQVGLPLHVENLDRKELSVSAISLCKRISDVSANARKQAGAWAMMEAFKRNSLVSNDTEFTPTNDIHFRTGENLYIYFEVFEPLREGNPETNVRFKIRVVDATNGQVRSDEHYLGTKPYLLTSNQVVAIGRGIDIKGLPVGSYQLTVVVVDSAGKPVESHPAKFFVD